MEPRQGIVEAPGPPASYALTRRAAYPLAMSSPRKVFRKPVFKRTWHGTPYSETLLGRFSDWLSDLWLDILDLARFIGRIMFIGIMVISFGIVAYVFFTEIPYTGLTAKLAKRQAWRTRHLKDRYIRSEGWGAYPKVLQSKGRTFRLEMKLVNNHRYYCELHRVMIYDAENQRLAARKLGDIVVPPQHTYMSDVTFKAPRSAKEFTVIFDLRGPRGCRVLRFPIRFE